MYINSYERMANECNSYYEILAAIYSSVYINAVAQDEMLANPLFTPNPFYNSVYQADYSPVAQSIGDILDSKAKKIKVCGMNRLHEAYRFMMFAEYGFYASNYPGL